MTLADPPEFAPGRAIGAPVRVCSLLTDYCLFGRDLVPERVWAISIARLCALPRLHLRPIHVLVLNGPCVEILS